MRMEECEVADLFFGESVSIRPSIVYYKFEGVCECMTLGVDWTEVGEIKTPNPNDGELSVNVVYLYILSKRKLFLKMKKQNIYYKF